MSDKYQIFVSSSEGEKIREIREVCIQAVMDARHFPSTLPRYGSIDDARIANYVSDADVSVLLLDRPDEPLLAQAQLIRERTAQPLLAFFVDTDRADVPADFLKKLHACTNFGTVFVRSAEIGYAFSTELSKAIGTLSPGMGWTHAVSSKEVASENAFFQRFSNKLKQLPVLNERLGLNTRLKRAIAAYFLERYLIKMLRSRVGKFFFESGSSIAFLSEVFSTLYRDQTRRPDLICETNNIVSYLEFGLFGPARVTLYPQGPPEAKYGATFGELAGLDRVAPPERSPDGLQPGERSRVEMITQRFVNEYVWDNLNARGIIFMASSGIDLEGDPENRGPHVGSYWNFLFKRALLASKCPTVIFLDETKLPRPFEKRKCYSVCDKELQWGEVCAENPLAIASSFSSEKNFDIARSALGALGFTRIEGERSGEVPWSMVACNQKFASLFPD